MTRHTRNFAALCLAGAFGLGAFVMLALAVNFPANAEATGLAPLTKHLVDNPYDDGASSGSGREGLLSPDEPDEGGDDDDDDSSDGLRRVEPDAPAGCMFRDGPLELIV